MRRAASLCLLCLRRGERLSGLQVQASASHSREHNDQKCTEAERSDEGFYDGLNSEEGGPSTQGARMTRQRAANQHYSPGLMVQLARSGDKRVEGQVDHKTTG